MIDNLVDFVAKHIDHTLLKIDVDRERLMDFALAGLKYRVRCLVVSPSNIAFLREVVRDSGVKIASVIAFPFGQTSVDVKIKEVEYCIAEGVDELDIVLNSSLLKLGDFHRFSNEAILLSSYIRREHPDIVFKFIVEVPILSRDLLAKAIEIVNRAKPDYFKTSTGFGPRGTTVDDVSFIRKLLSPDINIKASGGIRNLEQFLSFTEAGADLIGSSSGVNIIKEAVERNR